jgi:hypothetical protein
MPLIRDSDEVLKLPEEHGRPHPARMHGLIDYNYQLTGRPDKPDTLLPGIARVVPVVSSTQPSRSGSG